MHTAKYLWVFLLIISTFKTLLGKRKRFERQQLCVYRHYIKNVLSFCFIYLFVYWLAFFNGFNLHILPSVWVTKLTAERLQNLIQPSSPWQTSAYAANSHSLFLYYTLSLPWTSTRSSQLTHLYIYITGRFPSIYTTWLLYITQGKQSLLSQPWPFLFLQLLYMHEAVANTVCCWLQVSSPFIISTTLLSLPCCSGMLHGMSETS